MACLPTDDQKQNQVSTCISTYMMQIRSPHFNSKVIIGDELWAYGYDNATKQHTPRQATTKC
jgi:hypothetical protein